MPVLRLPVCPEGARERLKLLFRIIGLTLAFPVCYFVAAVIGAVVPIGKADDAGAPTTTVLLVSGPIHYDFLLPLNDVVLDRFGELRSFGLPLDHPEARWLLVGWGARDFYTTTGTYRDVSAGAVWRGLTGDSSVLRVEVMGRINPDLDVPSVSLSPEQFDRLTLSMLDSFSKDELGQLVPVGASGFTEGDRFFAGRDRFNVFRTCNTWVGKMLRSAGVRFGAWTPLPYSVTLSLRLFSAN